MITHSLYPTRQCVLMMHVSIYPVVNIILWDNWEYDVMKFTLSQPFSVAKRNCTVNMEPYQGGVYLRSMTKPTVKMETLMSTAMDMISTMMSAANRESSSSGHVQQRSWTIFQPVRLQHSVGTFRWWDG